MGWVGGGEAGDWGGSVVVDVSDDGVDDVSDGRDRIGDVNGGGGEVDRGREEKE